MPARRLLICLQSTHGARQLDYAPNPLDVLYEIRKKKPELFNKMEIYVDGGVREGAHIVSPVRIVDVAPYSSWSSQVMALALGAKGVGLGRLPLYANGTYGLDGVKKMCQSKSKSSCRACELTTLPQSCTKRSR